MLFGSGRRARDARVCRNDGNEGSANWQLVNKGESQVGISTGRTDCQTQGAESSRCLCWEEMTMVRTRVRWVEVWVRSYLPVERQG